MQKLRNRGNPPSELWGWVRKSSPRSLFHYFIPSSSQGHVKREMDNLREDIIKCLALLEALIDFGEGEDLEEGIYDQGSSLLNEPLTHLIKCFAIAIEKAQALVYTIKSHLADARRGEIVRSGIKLSIFGPPNAGKSSLLNFLCRCCTVARIPHEFSSVVSQQLEGTQPSSPQFRGPRETSCPSHSILEAFRSSSLIPQGSGRPRIRSRTSVSSVPTKREF